MSKRVLLTITVIIFVLGGVYAPVIADDLLPFGFVKVDWANEVFGYRDYERNEEGAFERSTRAYAYIEIEGFAASFQDERYQSDISVDVILKTSGGMRLYRQENLIEHAINEPFPVHNMWFYIWVDIPWIAPRGKYLAEVVVRDLVGGQQITMEREIFVK